MEGCPVLTGPDDERCGQSVQVTSRSELHAHWLEQLKEELLARDWEAVNLIASERCPDLRPCPKCVVEAAIEVASIPIEEGGDGD